METDVFINLLKTDGEVLPSTYDTRESDTSKPIKIQKQINDNEYRMANHQADVLYNGGLTTFSGFYWMDTICLWQVEIESERVPNSGGFCVNNQPFLAVEDINPNFTFE